MIFLLLTRFKVGWVQFHSVMLLTAFNPALLINGPIWGQVDLVAATIALCAVLISVRTRLAFLSMPLFILSLLTKFQMICIAPVMGILFFYKPRIHLLGIGFGIAVVFLAFLPFTWVGYFAQAFDQAYINTLGNYPVTTLNAANLWILLTGNQVPDSIPIIKLKVDAIGQAVLTAKIVGILLFAFVCLWIFLQGISRLLRKTYDTNDPRFLSYLFQAGMLCSIAFFTLLPAMHERYLLPAVVFSLAFAACSPHRLIYPLALSGICALNMIMVHNIGGDIWVGLSLCMVGIFALSTMEITLGKKSNAVVTKTIGCIASVPHLAVLVFVMSTLCMLMYLLYRYEIHKIAPNENQVVLSCLPAVSAWQERGNLQINRTFDGNRLSVGRRRYAEGLGTHANSEIHYEIPRGAREFSFIFGVDDEVGGRSPFVVIFSVLVDGKEVWKSPHT